MIKIKSDKKIFEETKTLAHRAMCWSSYVQNDHEMTPKDIKEFSDMADKHIEEFKAMKTRILKHFVECSRDNHEQ